MNPLITDKVCDLEWHVNIRREPDTAETTQNSHFLSVATTPFLSTFTSKSTFQTIAPLGKREAKEGTTDYMSQGVFKV